MSSGTWRGHPVTHPGTPRSSESWWALPISRTLTVALGALLLGFLEFSLHTRATNAGSADCAYVNLSPLLFGPIALVAGAIAFSRAGLPGRHRNVELGLGALCVLVGVLHLLRAVGLIGLGLPSNPC